MAITLIQQPQEYAPAYNPLVYTATSTNVDEANFKFIFDIYVNDVLVKRVRTNPDSVSGAGKIDVHRIVETYVTRDGSFDTGFQPCPNSYVEYYLKIGEVYGTTAVDHLNLLTTSDRFAWNGVFDFLDFVSLDTDTAPTNYVTPNNTKKFLTNQPANALLGQRLPVRFDCPRFLYYIERSENDALVLRVTKREAGVTTTRDITNMDTGDSKLWRIAVDPASINTELSEAYLTTTMEYYNVALYNVSGSTSSEILEFSINSECTEHPEFHIVFLNNPGGFDSYTFFKRNIPRSTIERKSLYRGQGNMSGTSFVFDESNRGTVNYNTRVSDRIILNSDWVTEEVQAWLKELFTSPEIFLVSGTNLIAMDIINTEWEQKFAVNRELFNVTIELNYSVKNFRQRG